MSKERLSKLQKWILIEAYNSWNGLYKHKIYADFFNVKLGHYEYGKHISSQLSNSIAVTVSKSLKNLEKKGLVKLRRRFHRNRKGIIILTKAGIKKALMLISMEPWEK